MGATEQDGVKMQDTEVDWQGQSQSAHSVRARLGMGLEGTGKA